MTRALKIAIHVAVAFFAYAFAYQFVLWPGPLWWTTQAATDTIILASLYAILAAIIEAVLRVERATWRHVSVQDAFALARSTALTAVVFLILIFILRRADGVPRSVLLLAWMFHLAGLTSLRALRRMLHERSLIHALAPMFHRPSKTAARLLLVGDIGAADAFLRELARDPAPKYAPVSILATRTGDIGHTVRGVPVIGLIENLENVIDALAKEGSPLSSVLFLSPPDVIKEVAPAILGRLKAKRLSLLRLPGVTELSAEFESLPNALRELSVEELLARPSVQLDLTRIHDLVNGRRVLVTGAGGSIGSEICRQVAAFGCAHLTMLDHSEFSLFKIDQEIAIAYPDLSRRELICDVRDHDRAERCLIAEKPDIVFHAAALKHVPMVENHPCEGVLTNVIGTWNVAAASRAASVGQMVLISTDKAVDPSNVMGATKRLAEAIVRGQHGQSKTRFSVVRFGNVLGSTGSVVPVFQEQIARGGPVTVTHPDIDRYFMTIPEAVQLVLYASAESGSRLQPQPSVFVLDMGEPVKIVELARTMISLHGMTPDDDIPIVFTGLRPGEKLTEDLVDSSERVLARLQSVTEVVDEGASTLLSAAEVQALEGLVRSGDEDRTRQAVYEHVARLRRCDKQAAE